jgi:hypothetical protein
MNEEHLGDRSIVAEIVNRRRSPRIPVGGRLTCTVAPLHLSVTLLNISRGGFFMRAPIKCAVGDVQRFQFTVDGEREAMFVLRARVVHCAPLVANGRSEYLIGLEFADADTAFFHHAITYLIDVLQR